MRRHTSAVWIGLLLFGASAVLQTAQTPDSLYVIEATYVRVEQGSHLPPGTDRLVKEEGTYRIVSEDGRYRIDRTVQGEHTAEIWDWATQTRIGLNYESQRAVTRPMFVPGMLMPLVVPSTRGPFSVPTMRPLPDNLKLDESRITQMVGNRALLDGQEWLGTRWVESMIELVGVREERWTPSFGQVFVTAKVESGS